jgi:hypothetical protein
MLGSITRFNATQKYRFTLITANSAKNRDLIVGQTLRTAVYSIAQKTVFNTKKTLSFIDFS